MEPEKQIEQYSEQVLGLGGSGPTLSIDERIELLLRYSEIISNASVERAADALSDEIHTHHDRYSEEQRARAIAGMMKLALSTYEESTALDHAFKVSGLDPVLGALIYSLSAIHGPEQNLYLVSEGLLNIDAKLTASVLIEVAQHDPSERERKLALEWLIHRLPMEAENIAKRLPEGDTLAMQIQEQLSRAEPITQPSQQSTLSASERETIERILPAIQVVLSGTDPSYRLKAVEVLAQEKPCYAIPLLTVATQVRDGEVREAGLQALNRVDPVATESLRQGASTFLSRVVDSPEVNL